LANASSKRTTAEGKGTRGLSRTAHNGGEHAATKGAISVGGARQNSMNLKRASEKPSSKSKPTTRGAAFLMEDSERSRRLGGGRRTALHRGKKSQKTFGRDGTKSCVKVSADVKTRAIWVLG